MMAAMLAVLVFKISPIVGAAINGTFRVLAEFETALSQLILPRAVQRLFVFELNYRELSSQYLASRENVAAAIISSGRSPAFKMLQQRRLRTTRVSLGNCMTDFAAILIDTDRGELLSAAIERFNSFKAAERASFQSGILGRALVGHIEDLHQLIVISLAQFDLIRQEAIGLKLDKVGSHIKIEALEKFHAFGAVIGSSLAYSDSVDIPAEDRTCLADYGVTVETVSAALRDSLSRGDALTDHERFPSGAVVDSEASLAAVGRLLNRFEW